MGKISNAIQMLNYLNTENKYSVKELSEKIGLAAILIWYNNIENTLSILFIQWKIKEINRLICKIVL